MGIVVDEIVLFAAALIAIGGYAGLVIVWADLKKWVPEWRIITECRKKQLPCICLTAPGSGESHFVVGNKNDKGDPTFDTKGQFGIQVDPNFSGEVVPDRHKSGLNIYHFATTLPFAIDSRNAMAIMSSIRTVRKQIPELDILSNDQLGALLITDQDDLEEYCQTFADLLSADVDEDVDPRRLRALIVQAQELLAKTPIRGGWTSYAYAFKNISTAYMSQTLQQYGMLIERRALKSRDDLQRMIAIYGVLGFAGLMLLIGGGVAYSMVVG